jgi:hypothetical protein
MTAGTWTREYEKSLPGSVSHPSQYKAVVRYSPYLFAARREGIYRVDWPSGSWTLFYGKPNSGAVHEILPSGEAITIGLGDDGSEDLLIVSLDRAGAGQLILIRLSDHSVYGRSKMTKLKPASAVAA